MQTSTGGIRAALTSRAYLQQYLEKEVNIALFSGSAKDSLAQLQKQFANLPAPARAVAGGGGRDWDV